MKRGSGIYSYRGEVGGGTPHAGGGSLVERRRWEGGGGR